MESKKVKELKKRLEYCQISKFDLLGEALTLINELERKLKAKEGYYNAVKNMALAVFAERVIEKLKDNVTADNVDYFVEFKKILTELLEQYEQGF